MMHVYVCICVIHIKKCKQKTNQKNNIYNLTLINFQLNSAFSLFFLNLAAFNEMKYQTMFIFIASSFFHFFWNFIHQLLLFWLRLFFIFVYSLSTTFVAFMVLCLPFCSSRFTHLKNLHGTSDEHKMYSNLAFI